MKKIAIIGAGGLAREVKFLIEQINAINEKFQFAGYIVSDLEQVGPYDSKQEIIGDFSSIDDNIDCLAIGIGNPVHRHNIGKSLIENFSETHEFPQLIHPNVVYDNKTCKFGFGVIICASSVLTVNISLGDFSMINLACTLGHESTIGKGTVLNPTVNISGGVTIGHSSLIGTGAQVLQYLQIGYGSTVGAGACVTKDIGPKSVAVGVPAKVIKVYE